MRYESEWSNQHIKQHIKSTCTTEKRKLHCVLYNTATKQTLWKHSVHSRAECLNSVLGIIQRKKRFLSCGEVWWLNTEKLMKGDRKLIYLLSIHSLLCDAIYVHFPAGFGLRISFIPPTQKFSLFFYLSI